MAEYGNNTNPERNKTLEQIPVPERDSIKTVEAPTNKTEKQPLPDIKIIQKKIEHEAISSNELSPKVTTEDSPSRQLFVNRELKAEALHRSLRRIRKHLSAPNRALSKVIHQPVVDALSKVGSMTIARPSGFLGGSIIALLGSSYVLYTAKHYGFTYNYFGVFILFGGGYAAGLALEIFWYAFRRIRGSK